MSNSALICYSKISPNRNSPRKGTIKGIAIHCMAGQLSVETCGNVFAPSSRGASSNYGIGPDGRIGMYVEERDRAWTTSTSLDNYCVTIEVASDPRAPYAVTDAAYESLIRLCADICKRNGIKALKWEGNKALAGNWDRQNLIVHRWFSSKPCPGDYLYNRHPDIVRRVNLLLDSGTGGSGNMNYCGKGIGSATALEQMEVRKAAKVSSASLGHVDPGKKVEVLQILASGWLKVVWPGSPNGYGYTSNVGGKYYTMDIGPSKVPKWVGEVNTGLLNVRSEPRVPNPPNANVITQLGYMNQVDVCDEKNGWYYIRYLKDKVQHYGWVASNYITRE